MAIGVVEFTPSLELAVTVKRLEPELEAMANGFRVPVPCTIREVVALVAFTPLTVPLVNRAAPEVTPLTELK
jgi:hypothetical protein